VIASRNERRGNEAVKALAAEGDVRWRAADLADGKSVARLLDAVVKLHGRLDYAFNSGGGGRGAPVGKMTKDTWRRTIDGFLTSVFLCMRCEIRH
jgi:NAD(P)-dependent dehydrogenase (short-subunit alcohol dehydrogenase family)